MDTPYISYEDIKFSGELVRRFWKAGMQRKIELITGPFDPKDGLSPFYNCEIIKIHYRNPDENRQGGKF